MATTVTPTHEATVRFKRYVVFGAGRSGLAAARLLHSSGQRVLLLDEEAPDNMDDQLADLCTKRIDFQFGTWSPSVLAEAEALVVSPGIPLSHAMVEAARERSVPVIGELELGARIAQPPIFAVTGTNGKTTTTSLIAHILTHCGYDAPSCGNIGRAFCDTMMEHRAAGAGTILVTEVSSFQLETTMEFHPAAAWLLNLTPDHLDRHGDMAGYQEAKFRITRNQVAGDALVLNADDPRVMPLGEMTRAEVFHFSRRRPVANGAFLENGQIMLRRENVGEAFPLLPVADIRQPGLHNVENVLAACLVTFFCDLAPGAVADAIRTFPGVEHRIEFVCEHEGVRYYNDSKATNLDAMAVALRSFDQPVVLIAGGLDSGAHFELVSDLVAEKARRVIAIGESAPRIQAAWRGRARVECAESLFEACMMAIEVARPGEAVLLSPACKSFDQFKNFEERGRHFKATLFETLMGMDMVG